MANKSIYNCLNKFKIKQITDLKDRNYEWSLAHACHLLSISMFTFVTQQNAFQYLSFLFAFSLMFLSCLN